MKISKSKLEKIILEELKNVLNESDLSNIGQEALKNGDLESLGVSFDANHQLLRDLGVVTPALDKACGDLKKLGALGAKMSGAGMGGTSFGLFKTQAEAIMAAQTLEKQGYQVWQVNI